MFSRKAGLVVVVLISLSVMTYRLGNVLNHLHADTTPQEGATHMIQLVNPYGRQVGLCTATAIGPHALLTAHHCNPEGRNKQVDIDYATRHFHIQQTLVDDHDHDIYLLDGPAFKNTVTYSVRPAKVGEPVYMWGDGEGTYPSRQLTGQAITTFDPSDVDQDAGEVSFSLQCIPGDSGSAVYGSDGKIVALITYGVDDSGESMFNTFDHPYSLDFMPSFTDDQIKTAVEYVPTDPKPAILSPADLMKIIQNTEDF